MSVGPCLTLSSDMSFSQPSDAPSAGASVSEDRYSPHLPPRGWHTYAVATGPASSLGAHPHPTRKQNQPRSSTVLSSLHFSVPRMFNYIPTSFPKEFKAPVLCVFFAVALGWAGSGLAHWHPRTLRFRGALPWSCSQRVSYRGRAGTQLLAWMGLPLQEVSGALPLLEV